MYKVKLIKAIFNKDIPPYKDIGTKDINVCLKNIDKVLASLAQREEMVLRERFSGKTLEQIGDDSGVSRERIRQIQMKALRKMRHPTRIRRLMGKQPYLVEPKLEPKLKPHLKARLCISINELEISVRAYRRFVENNIMNVGDIVSKTPAMLLGYKNLGRKTLNEIRELLSGLELSLKNDN